MVIKDNVNVSRQLQKTTNVAMQCVDLTHTQGTTDLQYPYYDSGHVPLAF